MTSSPSEDRRHVTEITIEATPEQVWKALTDPIQLVAWFPLAADVSPGEGGRITLRWGAEYMIHCDITAWDPPRRLGMLWEAGAEGKFSFPGPTAIDIAIDGKGGATVLRLVHSGFREGEDWQREYDATMRGWGQELAGLKIYMERHAGKTRRLVMVRRPVRMPEAAAWDRLMGRNGLIREGSIAGSKEGDRYAILTSTGERLEGTVAFHRPGLDFCAVVDTLGEAYLQARVEDAFGQPEVHLWLSLWDASPDQAAAVEASMTAMLAQAFAS